MAPIPKVYLITGANRGIGLALVQEIVSKQLNVIVFATARNPSNATELKQLSENYPEKIEIIQYVATDLNHSQSLARSIEEKYGYIDIVIANSAMGSYIGPISETSTEVLREHFDVNVVGVLMLFQATASLLRESKRQPKFIPISSMGGSITGVFIETKVGVAAYGISKVALNYLARRIHFENEWLVCFPLSPGVVETDMARSFRVMDSSGILTSVGKEVGVEAEQAAPLLVDIIDSSTREKDGGEFINIDGSKVPW